MTELNFKGKELVYNHHLAVPYRPLQVDAGKGIGRPRLDGSLIIHGDNLEALKTLLPLYVGKVDCVFIDPPYNTGNNDWCYKDRVEIPIFKDWSVPEASISLEDGLRHEKWCAMMWPRLRLLRELLTDGGVIFVSIDDNEQHHLRLMMDEIFGERNFVASFIWHHRKSSQNDIDVSLSHNYIHCYARHRKSFSLKATEIDESRFSNPDNDPRGAWVADPMDAPGIRENLSYEIVNPNTGTSYVPPAGRHWRFSREKFEEALKDNRIVFGRTGRSRPQYRRFLFEAKERGTNLSTIWSDVGTATDGTREVQKIFSGEKAFSTAKPTSLLKKIIKAATEKDSVVLDSFAGSGTTAHAVQEVNREDGGNRKFILVECEDYADDVTAERVRRIIRGYSQFVRSGKRQSVEGTGGGFTYCTLDAPLELDKILCGKNLPSYDSLGAVLFHMATQQILGSDTIREEEFYLGETRNRHLWMKYKPDLAWLKSPDAALTLDWAREIAHAYPDTEHLVFAPCCYVGRKLLAEERLPIEYLPFPYALYRMIPG